MKISEIITDKYKLRIPPTVYYNLLADVQEVEEEQQPCEDCVTSSGYSNNGDWIDGYSNSGDWNSGDWNSGDWNDGDFNSGDYNSGDRNSGNWNSGNWNSGLFNTSENPTIKMFDKESNWTIDDWYNSKACSVMNRCPCSYSYFIDESSMTAKEKECHPEYQEIGGYVKVFIATAEDRQKWWDSLLEFDKQSVYDLPNFDADKFRECTGIEAGSENKE